MNHLLDVVVAHAAARPEAPCLVHGGEVALRWGALPDAAGGLAARLQAAGLGRGERVGLHLPRGPGWVVACLGVWAAGGAIVPLDPSLPLARREELAARAGLRLVVGAPLSGPTALPVEGPASPLPAERPHGDDLAWVIFSSGSTGAPKAVAVAHRGYLPMLRDQAAALALGPNDRCLWLLAPGFDASLSDVGLALLCGGALITEPDELLGDLVALRRCLRDRAPTYCDLPPRLLSALSPEEAPSLRAVLCGGEPLPPAGAAKWAAARRLVGVYGPTEATICASLWRVDPADCARAHLGRPVGGAVFRVVAGELWIGGPGVALGYLDAPEATAARFVPGEAGERWHRTGDRVVEDDDGALIFMGRLDRQRKVDGRLLCPEEVEAALRASPEVAEVACHFAGPPEAPALWATVLPAPGVAVAGLTERLAAGLRARLPAWMCPRGWTLGAPTRGPTGKAQPAARSSDGRAEPSGEGTPDLLAALLARVLDREKIDEHDDFAALGLDSLRAIVASARLLELGLVLAPEDLRAAASLAGLRARLAAAPPPGAPTDACIAAGRALAAALPPVRGAAPRGRPWLLTGATGGLGARVLAARLTAGEPTLALVRAPDPAAALLRLRRAFARYGLPEAVLSDPLLQIRAGSLAPGERGGPETALAGLAGGLSGLLHLAAAVDLSQPAAALWPVNVGATAALLRLAVEGGGLPVLFASTLSVFVDTDLPAGTFTEAMPAPAGQRVFGGYAETKLEAEALVEAAVGLPRCIVRYGLLVGDPITGRGAEADWLGRCLRGLAALGAVPEAALSRGLSIDLSPSDAAAAATHGLALALAEGRAPLRAHVAAPAPTPITALLSAMAEAGAPVGRCDAGAWMARLGGALGAEGAPAAALLGLARALAPERAAGLRALDLLQATGAHFDTTEAAACLGRPPIPPTTPALIARLVAAALAVPPAPLALGDTDA